MKPIVNLTDNFLKASPKPSRQFFQKTDWQIKNKNQTLFETISDTELSIFTYLYFTLMKNKTAKKTTMSILSLSRKIQKVIEKEPNIKAETLFEKVKMKRGEDHTGLKYGKKVGEI